MKSITRLVRGEPVPSWANGNKMLLSCHETRADKPDIHFASQHIEMAEGYWLGN
jgi:hypothetical protein